MAHTPEEYKDFIQTVFTQQNLLDSQIAKTKELDQQEELEQARFIVSLA